jgi:hypothetical protein
LSSFCSAASALFAAFFAASTSHDMPRTEKATSRVRRRASRRRASLCRHVIALSVEHFPEQEVQNYESHTRQAVVEMAFQGPRPCLSARPSLTTTRAVCERRRRSATRAHTARRRFGASEEAAMA